ncbi:MAG TPA: tellurite resistance TerB family protein [Roseococcus sp.]|nr:tellurite resistance TerB family protein [Roseococcus sp.]
MFDPNRIFDQLTGNRGGGGLAGSLDALGGGSPGGGSFGGGVFGGDPRAGGGMGGGSMGGGLGDLMRGGGSSGGGLGGLLGGMLGGGSSTGGLGGAGGMGGLGGMLGAGMGGGLLGAILGGRSSRSSGGGSGLMRMGGAAVLTALATRAFKAWQAQQAETASSRGAATPVNLPAPQPTQGTMAEDDHPFGLAVVRAMIAAAKADGSIDGVERERIFAEVEKLDLDSEEKGFFFQTLEERTDPAAIARLATNDSQKAELYLASRLVATPDTAAERAWLDALAHSLNMPAGLRQSLDAQAQEAAAAVAAATGTQA